MDIIKFSELIEDYALIIFFSLFIIDWGVSTWCWIGANPILSLPAKLFHYFFLLTYVTFPFVILTYSITWFGKESVKLKWEGFEKSYQFLYGIYFWVVVFIIQFIDFTSVTNNVISLSIIGVFFFTTAYYWRKVQKRSISIPIILLILYICNVLKILMFPFYNVDLFTTVIIIILWSILLLIIIGGVIWKFTKFTPNNQD